MAGTPGQAVCAARGGSRGQELPRRRSVNPNREDSRGGVRKRQPGSQLDPGVPGGVWRWEQPHLFDMQKEAHLIWMWMGEHKSQSQDETRQDWNHILK